MLREDAHARVTERHLSKSEMPLWRLYTLRVCYLILAGGLRLYIWPSVVEHTAEFAVAQGMRFSLMAGMGAMALLGFRYPIKMIPLVPSEMIWKIIYLAAFAPPLWMTHQITETVQAVIIAMLVLVVFVALIPSGYLWRRYVLERGERWH